MRLRRKKGFTLRLDTGDMKGVQKLYPGDRLYLEHEGSAEMGGVKMEARVTQAYEWDGETLRAVKL